jgi:hypothetical protein
MLEMNCLVVSTIFSRRNGMMIPTKNGAFSRTKHMDEQQTSKVLKQ